MSHGDQSEFDPVNWSMDLSSRLPSRAPNTNLDILIVGAGFSGLVSALECWRHGHNVIGILDRNNGPLYTGT
jgi:NADPH-dependent 2,4-dienoyl-CoA reductase/sulfur reductase-like enzyme